MTQTDRTRTFSWDDPAPTANLVTKRSGLDALQAMIDGEIPPPPIMRLMDMTKFEAKEGWVAVELPVQEFHYNPLGTVHGGVLATLLDTAAGCAVHTTLPAGFGFTSLDLSAKFLRPVTISSGLLRCEGAVLSRRRRIALAESKLTDERGHLVAHATSSCLIFEHG